jgi:hypothetical protein
MNFAKLKIEYFLIIILIGGMFLIGDNFLTQLNFADNSQHIEKGEKIELTVGDALKQKFIAQQDGLSNVKILFGNRKLKKGYFLEFILADENCQHNFYKKILKGGYNFNSKYLYDFRFPIIINSKNQVYCLKLIYKSDLPKPKKKNRIRLFAGGHYIKNDYVIVNKSGEKKGIKPISLKLSYKNNSMKKDLQELNRRMSQYKPWFLKDKYLTGIIFLAIISTIISSLALIGQVKNKTKSLSKNS